jgi:hypothetical protein
VIDDKNELYILGDSNSDLMNNQTERNWLNFTETFGLTQIVDQPTRETDHSKTLIDHIYTNMEENVTTMHILWIGLSDYLSNQKIQLKNRCKI